VVGHEQLTEVGFPWRKVKGFLREGWAGEEERRETLELRTTPPCRIK